MRLSTLLRFSVTPSWFAVLSYSLRGGSLVDCGDRERGKGLLVLSGDYKVRSREIGERWLWKF